MKFVGNSLSRQPRHGLFQLAKTNGLLSEAAYFMLLNPNRSLEKASCHFLMTAIRKTALYILDP